MLDRLPYMHRIPLPPSTAARTSSRYALSSPKRKASPDRNSQQKDPILGCVLIGPGWVV
ncbi:uncharacterized protein SCHCODRAFT_02515487 [Schizophyllum commune H4-8]|uniref:uncharacterized protein n=1 Tax=Schizophyllum commune (strain H4-8 / FGSC 9210) TaxID=578458 RepID=UPI002160080E|nr:uncharacterized protein SCHCODRAFT_02515487 [Schizophyllum commune H4-8]KAI5887554.1 hypothetical protein SCHCODRAFT_02515487 [Schizophyllum commune H4-8]